jgi:hypothetical protein
MLNYTDLVCELATLLPIRGIQIGEMAKLGWLIGLAKHALHFLCLLLP